MKRLSEMNLDKIFGGIRIDEWVDAPSNDPVLVPTHYDPDASKHAATCEHKHTKTVGLITLCTDCNMVIMA